MDFVYHVLCWSAEIDKTKWRRCFDSCLIILWIYGPYNMASSRPFGPRLPSPRLAQIYIGHCNHQCPNFSHRPILFRIAMIYLRKRQLLRKAQSFETICQGCRHQSIESVFWPVWKRNGTWHGLHVADLQLQNVVTITTRRGFRWISCHCRIRDSTGGWQQHWTRRTRQVAN